MDVNSPADLLRFLISCAFRRCRVLDDLCRLSVCFKPTPPLVQISVSDTGIGSSLEEFQDLKYRNNTALSGKWDGVFAVMTTCISDKEIRHLKFDLKEVVSSRRFVRLQSSRKNGAFRHYVFFLIQVSNVVSARLRIFTFVFFFFSGTEVSLSFYEEIDGLATMMKLYLQKILLLKAFKIAIELIVETGGGTKSVFLQSACSIPAMNVANIDNLKLGLEEYVSKHRNRLVEACHSCSSTGENLKIGTGVARSKENQPNSGHVMEVVIILSDLSMCDQSSCSRSYGPRTEVLYFRDFSPCSVPQPSLEALISIDWKNYGLALKNVGDQDGVTLLEWEDLPPSIRIDIVLHIYHKQLVALPCSQNNRIDKSLTKKAVKLALSDLKKRNTGALLSQRAVKICSYAPDLAKTISGLIMSSNDLHFKQECFSLLGLPSPEEKSVIENCIKDKIVSVVVRHDRSSWATREASSLFADCARNPDDEYEGDGEGEGEGDAFEYSYT